MNGYDSTAHYANMLDLQFNVMLGNEVMSLNVIVPSQSVLHRKLNAHVLVCFNSNVPPIGLPYLTSQLPNCFLQTSQLNTGSYNENVDPDSEHELALPAKDWGWLLSKNTMFLLLFSYH